ncbi:MAG: HAD family hydrolase [Candidatus Brockarchaeota archaeon]|nr:HAD family hydrolase [Candidatus Brockarchaeota archaeon]
MKSVKAVLFDLDGTLVDTMEAFHNMVNNILREFSIPERSFNENVKLVGKPSRVIVETILRETGLEIGSEEFSKIMFREWVYNYMPKHGRLYPDSLKVLNELKNREYLLGVVSNTSKEELPHYLNSFKIRGFFDVAISSGDVENPKPSPEPVLKAIRILNIRPFEAIMVGDRPEDVEAGRLAGTYTIAVFRGVRPRFELEVAKPDFIVNELSEILIRLHRNRRDTVL